MLTRKSRSFMLALVGVLCATTAHAQSTFSWGLSAEENTSSTWNYLHADAPYDVFTTGGERTLTSGAVSASVNGWGDPVTGFFKSITQVHMSGDTPINIADSYVAMNVTDVIRINGASPTTTVSFTLDYDTTLSGLGMTPFPRYNEVSHFMQAWSDRSVVLTYEAENPSYDPSATCTDWGSDGIYCPPETEKMLTVREAAGKGFFREWALGGPNGVYSNGDAENGHYSGQVTLTAVVPTNVNIQVDLRFYNGLTCFHMADCHLVNDSSHSDYVGLQLEDGFTFDSAHGYQYLGKVAAVPEPSSLTLMGVGLLTGGLLRRRRKA